ncbi:carbohydrate ABC transporter membrane protein 1 (CUT1 family) [Lacrimispora xylanisolvens]|uniref:Carbohydrate ABC transporter membrane protein 1 (CUT1 family) n=1 Tax=Lacrimispora xylanisolvens TaxID=384636 RepID=A0A2S6HPZ2_9FIRM|nr:sugar ABC transporter permease [Hungatella xylanolytica]PPK79556.1 carbohydrate ABC transporter membrane protein 1 (CUT1 family) [Hungatella xylanolytica]
MKQIKSFFRYDNIGLLYALPAFLYMLFFVGYPIVSNLILSLQNVTVRNLVRGSRDFIGFDNYIKLMHDPVFLRAMFNTLLFTVSCLVVQFVIGFALALLFQKDFSFARPVRGLLMIPWMIPMTVTALIFKFMFSTDVGIINYFLKSAGLITENIQWLTSPSTAMAAVITANIWIGIPFNTILISTGLTTIPLELYESAAIDGANGRQKFFKITIPLMRTTIESLLVLGFIYTFKVYDMVYVMTGGGPVNSTHLLSTYSYKLSFEMFQYSLGSSAANVLLVILLLVGVVYLKITMKGEME